MYHLGGGGGGGGGGSKGHLKTLGVFGPYGDGLFFFFGETPKVWCFYPVETPDCTPWV